MENKYKPSELLFAATSRCRCGAGLAYPLDHDDARKLSAWACSDVLLGLVGVDAVRDRDTSKLDLSRAIVDGTKEHDLYPFWCYEITSEGQPSAEGRTTRHADQGRCMVRLECTCSCGHAWVHPDLLKPSEINRAITCAACGKSNRTPEGYSDRSVVTKFVDVIVDPAPSA